MKKKTKDTIVIGIGLVLLSILLHYVHYLLFRDAHHTMIFLVADIAFIPMEVFFTTLIIDRMLENREKEHFLEKLNMLIGVFYTEVGTKILSELVNGDEGLNVLKQCPITSDKWDDKSFRVLRKYVSEYEYKIKYNNVNLKELKIKLNENRDLLLTLITNENLHDHETFTEMLMAIMHLKEEIDSRCCEQIEQYEITHIESDMSIAYKYLTIEWCQYMNYLSKNYPRLFVKALINNPFDSRSKKEKDSMYLKQYNEINENK